MDTTPLCDIHMKEPRSFLLMPNHAVQVGGRGPVTGNSPRVSLFQLSGVPLEDHVCYTCTGALVLALICFLVSDPSYVRSQDPRLVDTVGMLVPILDPSNLLTSVVYSSLRLLGLSVMFDSVSLHLLPSTAG